MKRVFPFMGKDMDIVVVHGLGVWFCILWFVSQCDVYCNICNISDEI